MTMPKVKKRVKPQYTPRAMAERVAGIVLMQAVVHADGRVGEVRVVRSLHSELDEKAIEATRGWRFEPATFQGQPVSMVVTMEMTFTLGK